LHIECVQDKLDDSEKDKTSIKKQQKQQDDD